jgi:hypothetical protein
MSAAGGAGKKVFLCLIASVLFTGAAARRSQADSPVPGKFVFEYCQSNAAWGYTLKGMFIDTEGAIWQYDHSAEKWLPSRADGLLYEFELKEKYRNATRSGAVDRAVLSAMIALIGPASRSELKRRHAGNDMGSRSYKAYLYDPAGDTYKEVMLSSQGDWTIENASDAARTLTQWLGSVFLQQRSGPDQGGDQRPRPQERIRPIRPEVKAVQKVPAPKPEIKVEQRGPFPVENSEAKDQ